MQNQIKIILLSVAILSCSKLQSSTSLSGSSNSAAYFSPSLSDSFDTVVASATPTVDYVFGTSAVAGPAQTAITNISQLGQNFNPFADFTGQTLINSELQRYQPFSSSSNFVFGSGSLNLNATLDSGGTVAPTLSCHTYGFTPGSAQNFSSNTRDCGSTPSASIIVGQVAVIQYSGIYYVSAVDSSSVTLMPLFNSNISQTYNSILTFLPWAYATLSADANSSSCLNFSSLPSSVSVGQFVSFISSGAQDSNAYGTISINSVSTNSICLNSPQSQSNGTGVLFTPPIRSAQIWSKNYWIPGVDGVKTIAAELTVILPNTFGAARGFSSFSSLNSSTPLGAWPAFWLYSGNSTSSQVTRDYSEVDVIELIMSSTQDFGTYTSNLHGPSTGSNLYINQTNSSYNWSNDKTYYYGPLPTNTVHKIQLVMTETQAFRYFDGALMKSDNYQWTSGDSAQIAANLAMGSASPNLAATLMFPVFDGAFPVSMQVQELKIWAQR